MTSCTIASAASMKCLGPDTVLDAQAGQSIPPPSQVIQTRNPTAAAFESSPSANIAVANSTLIEQNRIEDRFLLVMDAIQNMTKHEASPSTIKIADSLAVIMMGVAVGMLMPSDNADNRQYIWRWICFLLLIAGLAWVDITARSHSQSAEGRYNTREPDCQVVPWAVFWIIQLIVAYNFTSEHLHDDHKWTLHLLPVIIVIWTSFKLTLSRNWIKKWCENAITYCGGDRWTRGRLP
ncbi:hypothetical protein BT69DRAFT_1285808 [Atractiella rhizophila]|nr:hypothetical protein BT69DRAFT_1285808 [Atractiella rhizophila]